MLEKLYEWKKSSAFCSLGLSGLGPPFILASTVATHARDGLNIRQYRFTDRIPLSLD